MISIFSDIEFQLDNIANGIIIVVNKIKYIDIPSIPKYILIPSIFLISCTNW